MRLGDGATGRRVFWGVYEVLVRCHHHSARPPAEAQKRSHYVIGLVPRNLDNFYANVGAQCLGQLDLLLNGFVLVRLKRALGAPRLLVVWEYFVADCESAAIRCNGHVFWFAPQNGLDTVCEYACGSVSRYVKEDVNPAV
jgi:hypothetical protein